MDPNRLETQLSEAHLARLLALHGDEDVIELGSGAGFYTDRIAAMTSGTVYALDLQPQMHEFYRSRGLPGNVRLIVGNVTDLGDLPPASLDVACSISTWHESGGVIDLPGLARALRPQGRLVVVDWRRNDLSGSGPPLSTRFSKEDVAEYVAPCFRVTSSEDLGEHMFALVGVKREQAE